MLSLFFEAFAVVCGSDHELMASATDEVLSVISQGWKPGGSARAKKKGSRGKSASSSKSAPVDKLLAFMGNMGEGVSGVVAHGICNYIANADPEGIDGALLRDLVKSLASMQLQKGEDAELVRELVGDIEEILDNRGLTKTSMKNWTKFVEHLDEVLDADDEVADAGGSSSSPSEAAQENAGASVHGDRTEKNTHGTVKPGEVEADVEVLGENKAASKPPKATTTTTTTTKKKAKPSWSYQEVTSNESENQDGEALILNTRRTRRKPRG